MKKITKKGYRILACFVAFLTLSGATSVSLKAQSVDSIASSKKMTKPILFGEQAIETSVESSAVAEGERFKNRPVFQMGSTFGGVLPGLNVTLNSGLPSAQPTYQLRGTSPLVMVDGIPRSYMNIPIDQIESIVVINDAVGLSSMGMLGGNGVVNIITKKGFNQKLQVGFTAQFASSEQMFRPKFLQAKDYATLFNEALANDNRPPAYSAADITKYADGSSPYTHPNTDWYDYLLGSNAWTQQYNLNFLGGGRIASYYVDLNYYDQGGYIKEDKSLNSYSTQDNNKKYSMRARLDIKVTPTTEFSINAFGQMHKETSPGTYQSTFYTNLSTTPNNAYTPINPDNSLGGNWVYKDNLYGQAVHTGYYVYNSSDLNLDLNLKQYIGGALEGAYVSGKYSYNSTYRENLNRSKTMGIYAYSKNDLGEDVYTQLSSAGAQANTSTYGRQNRMIYVEAAGGYDFTSGEHSLQSRIQYAYNNYLVQNNLPFNNSTISGRFQYDYSNRYMVDLGMSYAGMNQFKKGDRWGFFPSVGLGWNIAKEDFFKEKASSISLLKLRASYGVVGDNLAAGYFSTSTGTPSYYYDYMYYFTAGSSAYFGPSAGSNSTLVDNALRYTTTWMRVNKLNIGLDLGLLNDNLVFTAEYFNNKRTHILQNRGTNNSGIAGITFPQENIGKQRISGFEFTGSYKGSSKDLKWGVEANASLYKTKVLFMDEPTRPEPYMVRTGKPVGQHFGYVADGFFQSQSEIDTYLSTHQIEGYNPVPGDLKYKDLNGDKIIDGRDITEIGHNKPLVVYGIFGQLEYKGFGFNMQWAGVGNRQILLTDYDGAMPFRQTSGLGYSQATEDHLNRWTPSNQNAKYPRVSVGANTYNESSSTFWLKNASYLRLKHVELSYSLPSSLIAPLKLRKAKVFVTGYNLLTLTSLKDRDPELISYSNIPNTKSLSFGVNIQF